MKGIRLLWSLLLIVGLIIPNQGCTKQMVKANSNLHNSENSFSSLRISQAPTAGTNKELEEAKQYFNEGQFEKAIELLKRLVVTKTLPKESHREAAEYLALSYVCNNQDEKAEEIFRQTLQEDPNYKPSDEWWPHKRFMSRYYKSLKKAGLSLTVASKSPGIKTIAIVDFDNNSIDDAEKYENLGKALSKILITDFAVLGDLKVVERERLQFLIEELKLQEGKIAGQTILDPASAPQLGKLLGAHAFVFGSFIRIGKTMRIDARIVKTETSEIFKTQSVEGKPDKIIELAKKLTLKITKNLDVAIKKLEKNKLEELGKSQIPIEALALFGDAMAMANREQYKDAFYKLEEALSLAPNFNKAQDMMSVIRPLVL